MHIFIILASFTVIDGNDSQFINQLMDLSKLIGELRGEIGELKGKSYFWSLHFWYFFRVGSKRPKL